MLFYDWTSFCKNVLIGSCSTHDLRAWVLGDEAYYPRHLWAAEAALPVASVGCKARSVPYGYGYPYMGHSTFTFGLHNCTEGISVIKADPFLPSFLVIQAMGKSFMSIHLRTFAIMTAALPCIRSMKTALRFARFFHDNIMFHLELRGALDDTISAA